MTFARSPCLGVEPLAAARTPDLLHGKAALTPEMALRIEKAFGPEVDHLLRMQLAYDVGENAKTRTAHLD